MHLRTLFDCALFTGTGIFTTIGSQALVLQGAADRRTMILQLSTFLGIFVFGFFHTRAANSRSSHESDHNVQEKQHERAHKSAARMYVTGLCVLEIAANVLCMAGLALCGGAIYQVVYSSIIIFTAILSYLVKDKRVNMYQAFAMCMITIALVISAMDKKDGSSTGKDSSYSIVITGFILSLMGTIVYAGYYVASESLITQEDRYHVSGQQLAYYIGTYLTAFVALYFIVYTIPRRKELLLDPVRRAHGDWSLIVSLFVALVFSAYLHTKSYFDLLKKVGATTTGVMQSLRTVGVFLMSALIFCGPGREHSCFTWAKACSTLLVVCGVFIYSKFSSSSSAASHSHSHFVIRCRGTYQH